MTWHLLCIRYAGTANWHPRCASLNMDDVRGYANKYYPDAVREGRIVYWSSSFGGGPLGQ